MRRILVTGGFGQLGQAIFVMSKDSHNLYSIATRAEFDITDGGALERFIRAHREQKRRKKDDGK